MKKAILFISIMSLFACKQEEKDSKQKITTENPKEVNSKETFCYLTVSGNDINYQDSIKLNLSFSKGKVEGVYEWIPAEKDARRGNFIGKKSAKNTIKGTYTFTQEGKTEAQLILITMNKNYAEIITAPNEEREMKLTAKQIDCN